MCMVLLKASMYACACMFISWRAERWLVNNDNYKTSLQLAVCS